MEKFKNLFKKKKDIHFKNAGPGYRLSDTQPPNESNINSIRRILDSSQAVPLERRRTGPDENVAKATLGRLEKSNPTAKPTLHDIMNEEKEKFNKELKMKEELEEKRKKKSQNLQNINPFKEFEEAQLFTCKTLDINKPVPFKEIIRQIKSSIFDNFSEDAILRSAMIIFNCNRSIDQNNVKLQNCLEILLKIISNLMIDDLEQLEKFKRIRRSKIEQKVLSLDGSIDFLFAIGFTIDEKDSDWLVYVGENSELKTKMIYLKDLLSTPQVIPIELDRKLKFVTFEYSNDDDDDDTSLKLTSSDVSKYYNHLQRAREINNMVISSETKSKLIANNGAIAQSIFTQLRFKFNLTGEIVEATFYSNEKLSDVRSWFMNQFEGILQGKMVNFKQGLTLLENDSLTLKALNLSPASTIIVDIK